MHIIPAINATSFEEAEERISIARTFSDAIHFDLADGTFTPNLLWGTVEEIAQLKDSVPDLFFEVHLMTRTPFSYTSALIEAGVERVIVHAEVISAEDIESFVYTEEGVYMLSLLPDTPIEAVGSLLPHFGAYQILSVSPGLSGQRFDPSVLPKVQFLRGYLPNATIEVDGGVNERTIRMIREAGADTVISASYIFDNTFSPKEAYEKLRLGGSDGKGDEREEKA